MPPVVSVVIGQGSVARRERSVEAVLRQTLGAVEAVVEGATALPARDRVREAGPDQGRAAVRGAYVMFVAAGEELDRHACLTLYIAAEQSGAQVVSGCGDHGAGGCPVVARDETAERSRPVAGLHVIQPGTRDVRLYRREFLESTGAWPVDEVRAREACAAAERTAVVPHRMFRHEAPSVPRRHRSVFRRLLGVAASKRVKRIVYRRVFTRLPVRPGSVVFESGRGRAYEGSPRAIYEELRASGHQARPIWSYAKGAERFPDDVPLVRRNSWAHYWAVGRAEFWVDDHGFPGHLTKRRETTYIQTWHGTPYELVGFDAPENKLASRAAQRRLRRSAERFDHLVVGSEHDGRTLATALRTKAEPLPVGQPRNDCLLSGADPERVDRIADRLGIDQGRTVVLYAPADRRQPGLDLEKLAVDLGDGVTLLVRDAGRVWAAGLVIDVTEVEDLPALLLLADVLVTDHAPVTFDYLLLDRPVVFYAPEPVPRRGTYFDLYQEGLGAVTRDQGSLTDAIRGFRTSAEVHRPARRDFVDRYAEYEHGSAAKAIVGRFFAPRGPEPRR